MAVPGLVLVLVLVLVLGLGLLTMAVAVAVAVQLRHIDNSFDVVFCPWVLGASPRRSRGPPLCPNEAMGLHDGPFR